MWHKPNILVTGASGFIGWHLVDSLLKSGTSIRVLTRREKGLTKNQIGKVEIWIGDLTKPDTLCGISDGINSVFHLAGETQNAGLYDAVNRAGTESLLAICQSTDVQRFLYLSSVGVIGARGVTGQIDETTEAQPRGAYEISKYAGECAALEHHQENGMQVTVVRPSIVFGEGRSPETDSFLSWLRAINARRFVLFGGDYISNYVYVGDVVAACLMIAQHPQTGGQVYNINEPMLLMTFVDEMASLVGVPSPPVLPTAIGAVPAMLLRLIGRFGSLYNRTIFSVDKLSGLGFRLPFGYGEGLRRTIAWYHQTGLLSFRSHSSNN